MTVERTFALHGPTFDHGEWRLEPDTLELVLKRKHWIRIDLERCGSCGEVLDWVFHYRAKGMTDKEIADMLGALERILAPRANLCSMGATKMCDSSALAKDYVAKVRDPSLLTRSDYLP